MSREEAGQINTTSYREALRAVGSVQCPLNITELLKERAVRMFGLPRNWTEAQVNTLGNIIAGLNATELQSLSPSVLPFLSQSVIPLIPPSRLAALSASQLKAMGPDNAAMVTDAQRAALGDLQRAALGEALGVSVQKAEVTTQSSPTPLPQQYGGAPRLWIMGSVVFLQPLLLLILG
ncbi:hypothetical protein MATL_G00129320 [Megalops atlanticus]|uniref:Uncharacterized protein n=1 Tax=Megalops atlanticus TaxID=7932 RepID=A0A9D3PYB7_MEGAT|nr:hypothetical protein MATL_G00129320 [Megalops atlanticus]